MEEFQVVSPSPLLAPYVKHYWFLKTNDISQPNQRIIPNGSACLVFHRESNMFSLSENRTQSNAFISGQSTGYSDLLQTGSVDMISVVFQPHGMKAFFTMPTDTLFETTVALDDIGDIDLKELQKRLMEMSNIPLCVRLIETFLLKRLNVVKSYNHQRVATVVQSINQGQMNIKKLAQTSCLSYKQFKRVFSEYVGINPKDFLRIVRFQKALYILQNNPQIDFTRLAFECEYYDQSHLIKEFKSLSGYTPGKYISICAPYSDYFS